MNLCTFADYYKSKEYYKIQNICLERTRVEN